MMKKILVAGGAGFIGSNFIRHILRKHKNAHILNYDALTYSGNLDNLKDVSRDKRYKFIKGNIVDKNKLEKVAKSKGLSVSSLARIWLMEKLQTSKA